jgi:hypothetical protein
MERQVEHRLDRILPFGRDSQVTLSSHDQDVEEFVSP